MTLNEFKDDLARLGLGSVILNLPDGIKDDCESNNAVEFLENAFPHSQTRQGHEYWRALGSVLKGSYSKEKFFYVFHGCQKLKAALNQVGLESVAANVPEGIDLYRAYEMSADHLLSQAFIWCDTPQGLAYWKAARGVLTGELTKTSFVDNYHGRLKLELALRQAGIESAIKNLPEIDLKDAASLDAAEILEKGFKWSDTKEGFVYWDEVSEMLRYPPTDKKSCCAEVQDKKTTRQNIDMSKTYTSNGHPVRLLCVDGPGIKPVIGIIADDEVATWTKDGAFRGEMGSSPYDLQEVNPYADFKIDEPVMALNGKVWLKRYFAGVRDGKPRFWSNGKTSWTTNDTYVAEAIRRPTAEELK